jgi:hypothetical protein
MEDAGDVGGARRIRLIAAGLDSAEGLTARAIIQPLPVEALPEPLTALQEALQSPVLPETPTRPPNGPGAPSAASKRRCKTTSPKRATILQLQPPEPPAERVRIALASEPQLSIRALARTADVSLATASKWRRVVHAERREGAAV